MTKIVLMTKDGKISPPVDLEGPEQGAIQMRFAKVVGDKISTMVVLGFRKTDQCVPFGDTLLSVYKETC